MTRISKSLAASVLSCCLLCTFTPHVVTAVGATQADKPRNTADLDGTWRLVAVEFGPNTAGEEALKGTTFVAKGNRYTISGPHINREGVFEIDRTNQPHTITVSEASATELGKQVKYGEKSKYHGIVRVEGDKLELCLTTVDKARPTNFAAPSERTTYYAARKIKQ
jgi:uncharacterized protein (TIGR03067 family)